MWAVFGNAQNWDDPDDHVIATFDDRNAAETYRSQSTKCLSWSYTFVDEYEAPPHNPLPEDDEPHNDPDTGYSPEEFSAGIYE